MIRTVIVDDEEKASENLKLLLASFCDEIEVVGIFNHPNEAFIGIKELKPALLFLDIQMPIMDGFTLLELLNTNVKVIFTTAHKDFAINAIKVHALDYLLKPIAIPDLVKAVNNAIEQCKCVMKAKLIKIPTLTGFDIVTLQDILYLKAENNYTEINYISEDVRKKTVSSKTLKYFEEILSGNSFFRIHESYIVNLHKVMQYIKGDGGTVKLIDSTMIDVSRRKKQEFLKLFECN